KASRLEEMPPFMGGGDMILSVTLEKTTYNRIPFKFEAGTAHIAGAIGLGAAVDWLAGVDRSHEDGLVARAVSAVEGLEGVRPIGRPRQRVAVVSFVVEGVHPHDAGTVLDREGIAVRTGHHCAQPLLARLGVDATVRASFGVYNDDEDVARLVAGIHRARPAVA